MSLKSIKFLLIFCFSLPLLNSFKILAENKNQKESISNLENTSHISNNLTEYLKNIPKDNYILGKGDVIRIFFNKFQETSDDALNPLHNRYLIGNNGTIKIPNINQIYVAGLTIDELEKTLNKLMNDFIRDINTQIEIISYRPIRVFLNGEVSFPGIYKLTGSVNISDDLNQNTLYKNNNNTSTNFYENNITGIRDSLPNKLQTPSLPIDDNYSKAPQFFFPTLFDAIREAGGITFNSDLSNIQITRINSITEGGGMKQANINFLDVLKGKNSIGNIRIYDGDSIYIPRVEKEIGLKYLEKSYMTNLNKKFIKVLVGGRVESPGTYEIASTNTLNEAIEIAGGAKFLKGKIKLLRINNNGTFEQRSFKYGKNKRRGSYKNPFLKQGDIVVVGKSPFNITSEVLTEFTAPFRDILSSYALYRAFQ